MTWIVLFVLLIVVAVLYVISQAGRPIYYRRKELHFLSEFAPGFVMSQGEGSVMVIGLTDDDSIVEIIKGSDTGGVEQAVTFRADTTKLDDTTRSAMMASLDEVSSARSRQVSEGPARTYVEVTISRSPKEIGEEILDLARVAMSRLGMGPEQRFTFHGRGEPDMGVWRRTQAESLEWMLAHGSPFHRWFARRQLEKLRSDEGYGRPE